MQNAGDECATGDLELWLVRHGETVWNAVHKISGWTDVELNERGRQMAKDLRPRLQSVVFDSATSSDLQRARDTAELAYRAVPYDERLRELDFGPLEGQDWGQLPAAVQATVLAFDEDCTQGGETISAFEKRVFAFVDQLPPGRHVLFVHGGVIRLFLRQVGADRFVTPTTVAVVNWTQRRLLDLHLGPEIP